MALHGVNLGGWLVLEKWMTPGLFAGTDAVDEYTFCKTASRARMQKLTEHRERFITEADFAWLAAHDVQAVRLPVGYWAFPELIGDAPYQPALRYVDKAFRWAKKHHIKVLLCLHGAPGSQNGNDHSGRAGPVDWPQPAHIAQSLRTIELFARRYGQHAALLGIELLNEPSPRIPRRMLARYYRDGYKVIRRHSAGAWIVFSDRFQSWRWSWLLHWPRYRAAYLDSHRYQCFRPHDKALQLRAHLRKVWRSGVSLRCIRAHRPIVVGEWSAALDAQSLQGLDKAGQADAGRRYFQAQLAAYEALDAWFYWSYKTELDDIVWSFRAAHAQGWL